MNWDQQKANKPKFESDVFTPATDGCRIKPKRTDNPTAETPVEVSYTLRISFNLNTFSVSSPLTLVLILLKIFAWNFSVIIASI